MRKKLVSMVGIVALIVSIVAVVPAAAEEGVIPEATPTAAAAPTEEPSEAAPTEPIDEVTEPPITEAPPTEAVEPDATPSPEATGSAPSDSAELSDLETSTLVAVDPFALVGPTPVPGSILLVKKTANGSRERIWQWTIEKSADQSSLVLSPGQSFPVDYTVTATATGLDGAWSVSGEIYFRNTSEVDVMVTDVVDVLGDGTIATDTCSFSFPFKLRAGYTAPPCTYTASGTGTPPTSNAVEVYLSDGSGGTLLGGASTVAVTYDTVSMVDECVDVVDSQEGPLGTACADGQTNVTFHYTRTIGPFDTCGDYSVQNIASFETNDSGATGSDDWTVDVSVPCAGSCSLTPGYWKTHSSNGPAPYDDTWALLGEGAAFFASGKTNYGALWVSPQGNAYWILAHAYIATVLNDLNGADTSSVAGSLAHAELLLGTYLPSSSLSKAVRADFIATADFLDRYNNGLIGPGHCSE